MTRRPVIATGQQIGAGWSPALSVAKALAALAEARRTGAEAVYWLADEDHDRAEVASVVGWKDDRLIRHRFRFEPAPAPPRAGCPGPPHIRPRLTPLWGPLPTRRSPPCAATSWPWASRCGSAGSGPSRPRTPASANPSRPNWNAGGAWTSKPGSMPAGASPGSGRRAAAAGSAGAGRLVLPGPPHRPAPAPGARRAAAGGPLAQPRRRPPPADAVPAAAGHRRGAGTFRTGLLAPVRAPLGAGRLAAHRRSSPSQRLCGALWIPGLESGQLDALRLRRLGPPCHLARHPALGALPAVAAPMPPGPRPSSERFRREQARSRERLAKLDRRLHREAAARCWAAIPNGCARPSSPSACPRSACCPGLPWLRNEALLDAILDRHGRATPVILVEEP